MFDSPGTNICTVETPSTTYLCNLQGQKSESERTQVRVCKEPAQGGKCVCSMPWCFPGGCWRESKRADLGTAKVAQLQLVCGCVDEQVLGLDIPMADPLLVDVVQGAAHLVHVQLHKHRGHALPALRIVLADAVHCLWHILQHQVLPDLVLLRGHVEAVLQAHHIGMAEHLHDLQLPVLVPLVLQHLLDGHLHVLRVRAVFLLEACLHTA